MKINLFIYYIMECVRIISHGIIGANLLKFKVPANINLIQYSVPTQQLNVIEAEYLSRSCKLIQKDLYLIHKKKGNILKSSYKLHITKPGDETLDLELTFDNQFKKYIKQGIILLDGTVLEKNQPGIIHLSSVLREISKTYPDKIFNVIQLSCRGGKYGETDTNELSRHFSGMNISGYDKINDLSLKKSEGYLKNFYHETHNKAAALIFQKTAQTNNLKRLMKSRQRTRPRTRTRTRQRSRSMKSRKSIGRTLAQ